MNVRRAIDVALAVAVWTLGFLVLRRYGTWLPLTAGAVSLAAFFLASDPRLRSDVFGSFGPPEKVLGATVLLIGATYAGNALLAPLLPGFAGETRALYALLRPNRYPLFLSGALLSITAAAEEVIFRGRLMPREGSIFLRSLVSSLVYAGAHLATGSPLLPLVALGCGFCWALVRASCRSVSASIVVHVAWDLAVLLLVPL